MQGVVRGNNWLGIMVEEIVYKPLCKPLPGVREDLAREQESSGAIDTFQGRSIARGEEGGDNWTVGYVRGEPSTSEENTTGRRLSRTVNSEERRRVGVSEKSSERIVLLAVSSLLPCPMRHAWILSCVITACSSPHRLLTSQLPARPPAAKSPGFVPYPPLVESGVRRFRFL